MRNLFVMVAAVATMLVSCEKDAVGYGDSLVDGTLGDGVRPPVEDVEDPIQVMEKGFIRESELVETTCTSDFVGVKEFAINEEGDVVFIYNLVQTVDAVTDPLYDEETVILAGTPTWSSSVLPYKGTAASFVINTGVKYVDGQLAETVEIGSVASQTTTLVVLEGEPVSLDELFVAYEGYVADLKDLEGGQCGATLEYLVSYADAGVLVNTVDDATTICGDGWDMFAYAENENGEVVILGGFGNDEGTEFAQKLQILNASDMSVVSEFTFDVSSGTSLGLFLLNTGLDMDDVEQGLYIVNFEFLPGASYTRSFTSGWAPKVTTAELLVGYEVGLVDMDPALNVCYVYAVRDYFNSLSTPSVANGREEILSTFR